MSEDTTQPRNTQATEREREAPRTTEEIATLLEALAKDQSDLTLARRLRDWSLAVEQHGQEQLRVEAASVQSEMYLTLERYLEELGRRIDAWHDAADRRFDTFGQLLDDYEQRIRAIERAVGGG